MNNYRKILLSSGVLFMTQGMLAPLLPIYAYGIGGTFASVGYVYSLPYLVMVIMTFGWGFISDRLGKRKSIIIITNVASSLIYFVLAYTDINGLIVLRCIQTFFFSSYILIPTIITEHFPSSKGKSLGRYTVVMSGGSTAGAVISGHIARAGFHLFFNVIGGVSLLFCILFFFTQDTVRERDASKFKEFFVFGEIKTILHVCVNAFVLMTATLMSYSIFYVFLSNQGVSQEIIGYITSLTTLMILLVSDAAGKACDTYGRKPLLVVSAVMFMGMAAGIGLIENMYVEVILWILPFYAFFTIGSTSAVSDLTSGAERGRGIGVLNSLMMLGCFVGGTAGGNLADVFGPRNTFLFSSLCASISLFLALKMKETKPINFGEHLKGRVVGG